MPSGRATLRRGVNGVSIVKEGVAGTVAKGIPVRELIFLPLEEFPPKGDEHCLYIDITRSRAYYWNEGQYWTIQTDDYVYSGTTEYWELHPTTVSIKDAIYIYTDFDNKDGVDVPSIKIGDGRAYVNSLPFIAANGITQEDIDFWNNKVSVKNDPSDSENIIFYTGKE
jgi:hypothetical protein